MQVLRAVLRWHGVVIADNPLGKDTAGRDRIVLAPPKGDPTPIPPERLGAWWNAARKASSRIAGDYYRFQLLTGCRGVEIHGHKKLGYPPLRVADVDLAGRPGHACATRRTGRTTGSCCRARRWRWRCPRFC